MPTLIKIKVPRAVAREPMYEEYRDWASFHSCSDPAGVHQQPEEDGAKSQKARSMSTARKVAQQKEYYCLHRYDNNFLDGDCEDPLPLKLHIMLKELGAGNGADAAHDSSIACWLSHGRAFIIRNPKRFESEMLTRAFHHDSPLRRYGKFLAHLKYRWGMKQVQSGYCKGSWYHECFLRGKPLLALREMKLVKLSSLGKNENCPQHDPEFTALQPLLDHLMTSSRRRDASAGSYKRKFEGKEKTITPRIEPSIKKQKQFASQSAGSTIDPSSWCVRRACANNLKPSIVSLTRTPSTPNVSGKKHAISPIVALRPTDEEMEQVAEIVEVAKVELS